MKNPIYLPNEPATLALGQTLAQACDNQGAWIYLSGELGAGKTTLVRGFLQGLGYHERVKSPSYTLIEPYEFNHHFVYHLDLYRIAQSAELSQLGLEEYFRQDAICLVEWPDHFLDVLPVPDLILYLRQHNAGRQIKFESKTPRGDAIMEYLLNGKNK